MPHYHNLIRNPFGESLDHEMVGTLRKKMVDEIIKMVDRASRDQLQILGRINGTYGEGKTFTLMKLKQKLEDPREFVRVSEREQPRNVAVSVLKGSEARAATKYSLYLYQQIVEGLGLDFFHVLRAKLEAIAATTKKFETTILSALDNDFSQAFIVLRDKEIIAWDWLRGQKLGPKELKELEVRGNIENSTANKYLVNVLGLLRILEYDALVTLVDETEYFWHFGTKKAIEMFVAIKEIYDEGEKAIKTRRAVPVIQLLALAPETWDDILELKRKLENKGSSLGGLQPFLDRCRLEFRLEHLSLSDTKDLVVELLKLGRPADSEATNANPFYPFDEKAVEKIHDKSLGIPRWAMAYAYQCLEKSDEEKVDVSRENAARWIRQYIGATGEEAEPPELEGTVHETEDRME